MQEDYVAKLQRKVAKLKELYRDTPVGYSTCENEFVWLFGVVSNLFVIWNSMNNTTIVNVLIYKHFLGTGYLS